MNDYVIELLLWPTQAAVNIFVVLFFTLLSCNDPASWYNRFLVFVHWVLLIVQPVLLIIWGDRSGFLASKNGTRWLEEIALWLLRSRLLVIPTLAVVRVLIIARVFRWVLKRRGHKVVVSGTSSACMLSIAAGWDGHFGSLGPYFVWREFWHKAKVMADNFDNFDDREDEDKYFGVYFAVDKLEP